MSAPTRRFGRPLPSRGARSGRAAMALRSLRLAIGAAVLAGLVSSACTGEAERADRASVAAAEPAPAVSPDWVRSYEPERAWNGFTLSLYRKLTPILIDMNGRLVHAWPHVRARSRVRLLPDCSLLSMASAGQSVVEYAWDGELRWEHVFEDAFPHHDLVRLANGNTLVLVLPTDGKTDRLVEIDREGRVAWEWHAGERLAGLIPERQGRRWKNLTHINSVQELPPNAWFDQGDVRFRPGNILISARNMNALFIIDRKSDEIVWRMDEGLDQQHEALMNAEGLPRPGYIQLFNNNRFTGRRSAVQEIDPRNLSVAWEYLDGGFYSATKGSQQALPNGNVLIVSSRGRRAFEVTRQGRVVWEWTPPFELQRSQRYGSDHCAELGSIGSAAGARIAPPPGFRYVDRELYEFAADEEWVEQEPGGGPRAVLRSSGKCSVVLLPSDARFELGYGVGAGEAATGTARFEVLAQLERDAESVQVFADSLPLGHEEWRSRSISLASLGAERLTLCVAIEEPGPARRGRRAAHWFEARIVAGYDAGEDEEEETLTAQELEERQQHLRSMGYVD